MSKLPLTGAAHVVVAVSRLPRARRHREAIRAVAKGYGGACVCVAVEHDQRAVSGHPGAEIPRRADLCGNGVGRTHPPFEWEPGRWAVPFGFPWTYPTDEGLERKLYDRMFLQTPEVFSGLKMDFYVQRFRSLWKRQLEFMAARGWQPRWRHPIWAQAVADVDDTAAAATQPVTANDLNVVSEYARADDQMSDPPSAEELRRRFEAGWLSGATAPVGHWHSTTVSARSSARRQVDQRERTERR